jgi:putative FmdB family regulatory protein
MAMYEYECRACGKRFERMLSMAEHEQARKEAITCPACGKAEAWAVAPLIGYKQPAG